MQSPGLGPQHSALGINYEMLNAAPPIKSKGRKQPTCSPVGDWLSYHSQTVACYENRDLCELHDILLSEGTRQRVNSLGKASRSFRRWLPLGSRTGNRGGKEISFLAHPLLDCLNLLLCSCIHVWTTKLINQGNVWDHG